MKAAPFKFIRAESLEHALRLLDEHGDDAKLIAGGQSLVPMMAMRLVRPGVLVDINRLADLKSLSADGRRVTMGATRRQRDVMDDISLRRTLPLVVDALGWVGHVQTRNRGTVGGSMAHADPSAELPLAAAVLGASMRLRSLRGGERTVPADEFFLGPMFTALSELECLVSVDWPVWEGTGVVSAFEETAMRHGDFAMAAAACQLQFDGAGICRRAAIGLGGMDGTPVAFADLASKLVGTRVGVNIIVEVSHTAAELTAPGADLHANADYRRHLGVVMLKRVLTKAATGAPKPGTAQQQVSA